MQLNKISKLHM